MDRDDAPFEGEPQVVRADRNRDVFGRLGISVQHALLIAASWAVLAAFIFYPELQLIAFGATVLGLALLNRAREDV
jgi:hypothetical protein